MQGCDIIKLGHAMETLNGGVSEKESVKIIRIFIIHTLSFVGNEQVPFSGTSSCVQVTIIKSLEG